jgi:DNA-binding transcriptional ArsR family regulator
MNDRLDLVFSALADPTRRAILTMLLEDDMAVTDVAAPFRMSLAAVSKHLQVLAAAGLIAQERRGRVTWCKLDPDAMRAASVWMQGFGQFDPVDLDGFERYLAAELTAAELTAAGLAMDYAQALDEPVDPDLPADRDQEPGAAVAAAAAPEAGNENLPRSR